MCLALVDGRALPAGELAARAEFPRRPPATISTSSCAAACSSSSNRAAGATTDFAARTSPPRSKPSPSSPPPAPRPPPSDNTRRPPAQPATCYNHFAGKFGVALADALLQQKSIELSGREYAVTDHRADRFGKLGIDVTRLRPGRRGVAYTCLDWSERRHHMAGPLATEIVRLAFARDWVRRVARTRAVKLTPAGRSHLRRLLDLRLDLMTRESRPRCQTQGLPSPARPRG